MRILCLRYPALAAFVVSVCLGSSLRAETDDAWSRMFQLRPTLAALFAFPDTTPAPAENEVSKRIDDKRGEIFQRIAAEQASLLSANTARVINWRDGQYMEKDGYSTIVWYGADGRKHTCISDSRPADNVARSYSGYVLNFKAPYPLKRSISSAEQTGYQFLGYNDKTKEQTTHLPDARSWWKNYIGHLQTRLPSPVRDNCRNAPSTEGLNAEIQSTQISRFYGELLQQSPKEGN
ncbi:hypothetical protein [uncultured Ruegeria sp.]|uniref:hypothetical protein n=1 Tax=uncultured Ruegeria sp. TaxID=259304 RepID=UPI00260ACCDB|nr:hypothetical protein [uncultured Ruegeria sp.]